MTIAICSYPEDVFPLCLRSQWFNKESNLARPLVVILALGCLVGFAQDDIPRHFGTGRSAPRGRDETVGGQAVEV